MRSPKMLGEKTVVAGIGVAAALGLGGTAYAATGPGASNPAPGLSDPAPTASSPAPPGPGGPSTPVAHGKARAGSLLGRADHATIELKVKGQWVTYTLDRGKVTAVSPASITLARPDGQSVTETINAATRFQGVTSEAGIQLNRPAQVISDQGAALRVRQGNPPARTGSPGAAS